MHESIPSPGCWKVTANWDTALYDFPALGTGLRPGLVIFHLQLLPSRCKSTDLEERLLVQPLLKLSQVRPQGQLQIRRDVTLHDT